MIEYVSVDHPRFRKAQRDIFVRTLAPDCMVFTCRLTRHRYATKLDACCQYGADVGVSERDQILAHEAQIRALLVDGASRLPLFRGAEQPDRDFPGGAFVRTNTFGDGCLFLAQDQRGCAIHRAALEGNWSISGVKPHVCRLFPLSYEPDAIVLSDDFEDYSCCEDAGAPTVYRVQRDTLADVFGHDLVAALDDAEQRVTAHSSLVSPRRLASRSP